ncbi:hypothetical protein C7T35_31245 [Variovorax sp. WS11]|nr:hypothetical protein C7T35_31245 [Variovorax sp. WS11]
MNLQHWESGYPVVLDKASFNEADNAPGRDFERFKTALRLVATRATLTRGAALMLWQCNSFDEAFAVIVIAEFNGKRKPGLNQGVRLGAISTLPQEMHSSTDCSVKEQAPILALLCLANRKLAARMDGLAPLLPEDFPEALDRYRCALIGVTLSQLETLPPDGGFGTIRSKIEGYCEKDVPIGDSHRELLEEIRIPAFLVNGKRPLMLADLFGAELPRGVEDAGIGEKDATQKNFFECFKTALQEFVNEPNCIAAVLNKCDSFGNVIALIAIADNGPARNLGVTERVRLNGLLGLLQLMNESKTDAVKG